MNSFHFEPLNIASPWASLTRDIVNIERLEKSDRVLPSDVLLVPIPAITHALVCIYPHIYAQLMMPGRKRKLNKIQETIRYSSAGHSCRTEPSVLFTGSTVPLSSGRCESLTC